MVRITAEIRYEQSLTLLGTLPTNAAQGVHSLTDVPVFAGGPCSEKFGGVYNSIDVFFKIADCLGLSQVPTKPDHYQTPTDDKHNWDKYEGEKQYGYHQYSEKAPRYGKESATK